MWKTDEQYLTFAYRNGSVEISCPQARYSLIKLGFMTPCEVYGSYWSKHSNGMTLTKKGQKRAKQIVKFQEEKLQSEIASRDRRGYRGAAFPKSYRIEHWTTLKNSF